MLKDGTAPAGWTVADGLLLFQGKAFVPDSSLHWPHLLADAHEAGHEGVQKTLYRLRQSFYNPHTHRRVRDFVKSCATCQRNKTEHLHPAGLLQPLPVPSGIWSDIAMDFVERFPKVGGKSVILTMVDRFPSMHTLFHSVIRILLTRSLGPSLMKLSACMGFLVPLSVIVILCSPAAFGKNFFDWRVFSCCSARLFILRPMVSQRLLIALLLCIFGASLVIARVLGFSGYLGLSFATIPPIRLLLVFLRSRLFMGGLLQPCFSLNLAQQRWLQLMLNYVTVMNFLLRSVIGLLLLKAL